MGILEAYLIFAALSFIVILIGLCISTAADYTSLGGLLAIGLLALVAGALWPVTALFCMYQETQ